MFRCCVSRLLASRTPTLYAASVATNKEGFKRRGNDNINRVFFEEPRCDFRHPSTDESDVSKGYFLRILHKDNFLVLRRHQQDKPLGEKSEKSYQGQIVSAYLPNSFIARMLSVIEGHMDVCDVICSGTSGTFSSSSSQPGSFIMKCKSDLEGNANYQWEVVFDIADAALLKRYLRESIHYNNGFYRAGGRLPSN